ncbi:MAG: FAD-dependent oxidoreductase [Pseudomonadota bacterium]|jgi:squalene-associated FAD-dependent desaturase
MLIVGGGWAGLAAAVRGCELGFAVTLLEATRTWGGRARTLARHGDAANASSAPSGPGAEPDTDGACASPNGARLDNGQHILIGAYTATLGLMQRLGLDLGAHLHAMPLDLRFAEGGGLATPDWALRWPAPFDTLAALLSVRGWSWAERLALLRWAAHWQRAGFVCAPQLSVADLCAELPERVWHELIEPLCVAALNTPAQTASAQVFLIVLRDALLGRGHPPWRAAQLLLPRSDLGALLPGPAVRWLQQRGAVALAGQRVLSLERVAAGMVGGVNGATAAATPSVAAGGWRLTCSSGQVFEAEHVILATPASAATRLLGTLPPDQASAQLHAWRQTAQALQHQAIATLYVGGVLSRPWPSAHPMLALRSSAQAPAQYAFRRDRLLGAPGSASGCPQGWVELALVASACDGSQSELQTVLLQQAQHALGLEQAQVRQCVIERRATFASTPGLTRPAAALGPGLWAAGDYVSGPYPATLEGAVRSGEQAAEGAAQQAASVRAAQAHPASD